MDRLIAFLGKADGQVVYVSRGAGLTADPRHARRVRGTVPMRDVFVVVDAVRHTYDVGLWWLERPTVAERRAARNLRGAAGV